MRKAGIPEALVRAVMSLNKGAKTEKKVGTLLSEEIEVNVGVHQGSASSTLLFAIVIYLTNEIKEDTLQEILYADDIVLLADNMSELHKNAYINNMITTCIPQTCTKHLRIHYSLMQIAQ